MRPSVVVALVALLVFAAGAFAGSNEFHRAWVKDPADSTWNGYQCGSVRFDSECATVRLYTNVAPSPQLPRKHSIPARFEDAGFERMFTLATFIDRRASCAEPVEVFADTAHADARHLYILEFFDPRQRTIEQAISDLGRAGIEVRLEALQHGGKLTWDRVLFEPF